MSTKLQRYHSRINDNFKERLKNAFAEKFSGLEIETAFNIFSMQLISERSDGKKFTKEQHAWVGAYSDGYAEAMGQIIEERK